MYVIPVHIIIIISINFIFKLYLHHIFHNKYNCNFNLQILYYIFSTYINFLSLCPNVNYVTYLFHLLHYLYLILLILCVYHKMPFILSKLFYYCNDTFMYNTIYMLLMSICNFKS